MPFLFRPKTSAVPVFPLTATGNPLKTAAAVPLTTTSRSAPRKNSRVAAVAGSVPITVGINFLMIAPFVLTIA